MSKPLPILTQMPWNIKQQIVDSLNTVTKQQIRVCSKDFKRIVRNSKISYKKIILHFITFRRAAKLLFVTDDDRSFKLEYTYSRMGHWVKNLATESNTFNKNGSFVSAIVNQSMKVFQESRKASCVEFVVKFETCYVQVDRYNEIKEEVLNRLQAILVSLKHRISVESFRMAFYGTQEDIMKILPHLEVGTLKHIDFWRIRANVEDDTYGEIDLSLVTETDQWKHAEKYDLRMHYFTLPLDKWSHFKIIAFRLADLELSTVKTVFQMFSNKPQFEQCEIIFKNLNYRPVLSFFLDFNPRITQLGRSITLHFGTPKEPEMFFRILFRNGCFRLSRLRRADDWEIKPAVQWFRISLVEMGYNPDPIELEPAQVLANFNAYINSPR